VIERALKVLDRDRLSDCVLFVTIEPCDYEGVLRKAVIEQLLNAS
jgi:pyrimidine deaminase RibD-like protein